MMPPFSVLVVIVNYKTPTLVIECLRSLEPEVSEYSDAKVLVVDNNSGDGSAELIAAAIEASGWSSWAAFVQSPINGGFSYGNNFGIRPALEGPNPPVCFWLLNPDTVVRRGALAELAGFMQSHPEVGICGGGIDEQDDRPWPYAFRFPSILSELENGLSFGPVTRLLESRKVLRQMSDVPARVDWVSGASLLVRGDVFRRIGLMDDDYFLYYEETDFCLKAQRAGFECWYVPKGRVMHIAGQSTGVTSNAAKPRRLPGYWFESRRRYFIKNHGRTYAVLADIVWMLSFAIWRLRRWMQRKPDTDPPHYLTDFFRHSAILNSRIQVGVIPRETEK